jgi:hypothetical protein
MRSTPCGLHINAISMVEVIQCSIKEAGQLRCCSRVILPLNRFPASTTVDQVDPEGSHRFFAEPERM